MAPTTPLAATVVASGVTLGFLAAWGLAIEVPDFWDPCMTWGMRSGDSLSPDDSCPSRSGASETRLEAAFRLVAVDGTGLATAVLAVWGGWVRGWKMTLAASVLMIAETVLLFFGLSFAFALTLGAGALFLVAALRWRGLPARPRAVPAT
ncbi:MAG: hypothetical protein ACYC2H_10785 [Thermoplasmatota archaeon]